MKLFHGSDKEVIKPIYGYGRPDCDYGSGFYLTADYDSAKIWASQYDEGGFVNTYKIDLEKLKVLRLDHNTNDDVLRWVSLLCKHRIDQETRTIARREIEFLNNNYPVDLTGVDIIIGYRADDSYFDYTRAFLTNRLPIELLKEAMILGQLGLQYALISPKAFDEIAFIDSTIVKKDDSLERLEAIAKEEYNRLLERSDVNHTYLRDIMRENSKHK